MILKDDPARDSIIALTKKLVNVQATYVGNKFDDTQTQNMFQDMASQINLMQRILKETIDIIFPTK